MAVSYALQPPPPLDHPVSPVKLLFESKFNVVPPTEITLGEELGYAAGKPLSPLDANTLTPGAEKYESKSPSRKDSWPPQLFDTYCA